MRFQIHDHRGAAKIVPPHFLQEIEQVITSFNVKRPVDTQELRGIVLDKLQKLGWSEEVRVDPTNSKIDITSQRDEVGLCFQTGNVSRVYADLLKLQTLFADRKIAVSICIVPGKPFAKAINKNVVNFDRFTKELKIFYKTITVPTLVYGIEE